MHVCLCRWCGDPGKLLILEKVLEVVKREKLLVNVNKTGAVLKQGLLDAQKDFPAILNSTRGRGTFLAINAKDAKTRDAIVGNLKKNGVQSGGCGEVS
jgi:4-aminobutyrate aminotransferase/(S)-3-amino-2-methylpropionate transaminase